LPGFNGAGLYLSVALKAKDGPAVFEKLLLQIYASLWTSTAFAEREYYGIDHRKAAMAILVNEAYKDEYANGVILTIPDKNGYAIAINTQFGDSAVTNPESGQVPEALLFRNNAADTYTVETKSNIHDIFLQPDWKPLLLELKQLTQKIHADFTARYAQDAHTAYGVDIEFKVVQDGTQFKLYIKQARPLGQVLPE
jgi:phosphoenolpyruvate synthase/pyruvate phosphate dikinase